MIPIKLDLLVMQEHVTPTEKMWCVVCLQHFFAAQGQTFEDLKTRLEQTFKMLFLVGSLEDYDQAPPDYWEKFQAAHHLDHFTLSSLGGQPYIFDIRQVLGVDEQVASR